VGHQGPRNLGCRQFVGNSKSGSFGIYLVERHLGSPTVALELHVTTQDFIKFWGKIFVFILLVLIENFQGFKTFEFI
jgi:hypothetical protein